MFGVLRPPSPPERRPPALEEPPPPARSLAPMPPREFSSREELLVSTKDWAATQGYAVVIARSRANRLWLKCDRGGNYENRRNLTEELRKRKRGESRLLGCPFRMIAVVRRDGVWRAETDMPEHNHGPSDDMSLHPTLRRMSEAQLAKVHEMLEAGKSPAETVEELKAMWPEIKILTRDVYNARKKYKTQRDDVQAAAGLAKKPVPDPNGDMPDPNGNGRWAWVPDGEEVTSKQSRPRRKKPTTVPPVTAGSPPRGTTDETLDPQLQGLSPMQQLPQGTRTLPSLDALMNPSDAEHGMATQDLQYQNPQQNSGENPNPAPATDNSVEPARFDLSDERRTSPDEIPTAGIAETPPPAETNDTVGSPNILAARMARMEKEQQDQKNMLAQILGAVKGMSGSSPI